MIDASGGPPRPFKPAPQKAQAPNEFLKVWKMLLQECINDSFYATKSRCNCGFGLHTSRFQRSTKGSMVRFN